MNGKRNYLQPECGRSGQRAVRLYGASVGVQPAEAVRGRQESQIYEGNLRRMRRYLRWRQSHVLREIGEHDREYFYRDEKIDCADCQGSCQ